MSQSDQPSPAALGQSPAQMSRRSVLRGAAGAGAAGLTVSTLAGGALASPVIAAARHHGAETADRRGQAHDEAVVVHIRSVRTGEMDVYRGTTHVRLTDRALAASLARASR